MKKRKRTGGNFVQTFWYCMKLSFQSSKLYTIFRLLYSSISAIIVISITYIGKIILDILVDIKSGGKQEYLLEWILLLTILTIVSEIGLKINEYISSMHNDVLKNAVTMKLMNISTSADMEFFDSPQFYDAFESVKQDTYAVINVVWSMMRFISYFISLCSAFFILEQDNLLFGIIIIIATIPTAIVSKKFVKQLYFWGLEHMDDQRKMHYIDFIVSDKMYAADIRLYQIGEYLKDYYNLIWQNYFNKRRKVNRKRIIVNSIFTTLPLLCTFFMLLVITNNIINGTGTIGDYSLYAGMLTTLSSSTFHFIDSTIEIYENKLKMDNIKNFNQYKSKIEDNGTCNILGTISIEFKDVSFCYPNTNKYVLKNVSFKIEEGEHIGIVGLNGSGKSTLIKLLLRFYDPTSGQILINDRNIKEYPIQELRSSFSTFFQQYVIFAFSMKENISMFDSNVNEEKILQVLEYSDAMGIYELLDKDLDTFLTKGFEENGVELSGGQRQKIALARAFYREGKMVILDEPSAALDPEAEYKIFQRMKKLCKGKSAIFVSHRLSNIVFADRVILLEQGKVIEQGTHKELLQLEGRYAELFQYQAKQYEDLKES